MLKITTENTKSILRSSLKVFDESIVLLWSLLCRDFNLSYGRLIGVLGPYFDVDLMDA